MYLETTYLAGLIVLGLSSFVAGFVVGRISANWLTESEMIERLSKAELRRKLDREAHKEVADKLQAQNDKSR